MQHDIDTYYESYKDMLDLFYKHLRKMKFPVAKLHGLDHSPSYEEFHYDSHNLEYEYRVRFIIRLRKGDDDIEVEFHYKVKNRYTQHQYETLDIWLDKCWVNNQTTRNEAIDLLKAKGTTAAKVRDYMSSVLIR